MRRHRGRFLQWVQRRFFLRFHMALMLLAAFGVGLIVTKILLELRVDTLWLRYLIAVVAAYLAFLALIRLWLFYLGFHARQKAGSGDLPIEFAEVLTGLGDGAATGSPAFEGAGGNFGGAGATGRWDAPARLSGGGGKSGGSGGLDVDLDPGDAILVVLVGALALSIVIVGVYLIWAAPAILAEAAFEATLASALLRRARRIDSPGWAGSVVRATIIPFLIVLSLSIATGWYAQKHCPAAKKIMQAFDCG